MQPILVLLAIIAAGLNQVRAVGMLVDPPPRLITDDFRRRLPPTLQQLPSDDLQKLPNDFVRRRFGQDTLKDFQDKTGPCGGVPRTAGRAKTTQSGRSVGFGWNVDKSDSSARCSLILMCPGRAADRVLWQGDCKDARQYSQDVQIPRDVRPCGEGECFIQWSMVTKSSTICNCADVIIEGPTTSTDTTTSMTSSQSPTATPIQTLTSKILIPSSSSSFTTSVFTTISTSTVSPATGSLPLTDKNNSVTSTAIGSECSTSLAITSSYPPTTTMTSVIDSISSTPTLTTVAETTTSVKVDIPTVTATMVQSASCTPMTMTLSVAMISFMTVTETVPVTQMVTRTASFVSPTTFVNVVTATTTMTSIGTIQVTATTTLVQKGVVSTIPVTMLSTVLLTEKMLPVTQFVTNTMTRTQPITTTVMKIDQQQIPITVTQSCSPTILTVVNSFTTTAMSLSTVQRPCPLQEKTVTRVITATTTQRLTSKAVVPTSSASTITSINSSMTSTPPTTTASACPTLIPSTLASTPLSGSSGCQDGMKRCDLYDRRQYNECRGGTWGTGLALTQSDSMQCQEGPTGQVSLVPIPADQFLHQ